MSCKLVVRMIVLSSVFLFFVPVGAQAMEPQKNTASLGIEVEHHHYDADHIDEKGLLYGANGAYTYRGKFIEKLPKGMFRLEGRIIFGRVNFDGEPLIQFADATHYEIKRTKHFNSDFRALGGYDFSIFSSTTITPFVGLGYRYYKDDLSKSNAGYRRYSNYFYTPIGVETHTPLTHSWSAGIILEYDMFWFGRQDTALSDLDSLFSDFTNDQTDGYGFRGSIKIRKEMDDKNFVFEPYINYWNIDASDPEPVKYNGSVAYTYAEPQNTTTEIGMKVGVEF